MLSPHPWRLLRSVLVFGLAALALPGFSLVPQAAVQAGLSEPGFWQDDYPPPVETVLPFGGYPAAEETGQSGGSLLPPDGGYPEPGETQPLVESNPTPAATQTPAAMPTATQSTAAAGTGADRSGFQIDWSFFWIGFAIPLLAGSGVVLYFLDHRPDLFRPRSKP
jgi:hypothetical protein